MSARDYETLEDFFSNTAISAELLAEQAVRKLNAYRSGDLGFRCGLTGLDPYLKLLPSELSVIAARSGAGKTALGMQIVYRVLQQMTARGDDGRSIVVVFSAEMDSDALLLREACARSRVNYSDLVDVGRDKLTDEDFDKVQASLRIAGDRRIFIDQSSAPTLEHMVMQLAVLSETNTIAMVMFDYTELSGELDRQENQRIAKVSRGLKAIARKFDCPVLTLSQLSRDIERRTSKRPRMSDLMHGGEREPDRIIILSSPDPDTSTLDPSIREAYVVKNRHGPAPVEPVYLQFDGPSMTFTTVTVEQVDLNQHLARATPLEQWVTDD